MRKSLAAPPKENMAIEGKLTGWFELTDGSRLGNDVEQVVAALKALKEKFPVCELEDVIYTQVTEDTYGSILSFSLTWWEETPPFFAEIFADVVPVLNKDQNLVFDCKLCFGARSSTLWVVLVTELGVFSVSSPSAQERVFNLYKEARAAEDVTPPDEVEAQKFNTDVDDQPEADEV
jgi:hypothetical protein